MIVVSGCPRSGTSLMMDLMRTALGDDRIIGEKFPQMRRINPPQREHETAGEYQVRQYVWEQNKDQILKEFEESRDMNPNGFWEMLYTCAGVYYRLNDLDRLTKLENEDLGDLSVCKIVSQGLAQSDPRYIHKIVYMIRHPRAVAKSQERLKRGLPSIHKNDGSVIDLNKELTIHTPEMYIQVTGAAASWLKVHADVPVHYVYFDELIEKPTEVLTALKAFIGYGDFEKASEQIEPRLRRSSPEDVEHNLWEDAEHVYDLFQQQKFQEIIMYLQNASRATNLESKRWHCPRRGSITVYNECKNCSSITAVKDNFKKTAERYKVDWRTAPCLFECGMNTATDKFVTIEDSIKNNFWV